MSGFGVDLGGVSGAYIDARLREDAADRSYAPTPEPTYLDEGLAPGQQLRDLSLFLDTGAARPNPIDVWEATVVTVGTGGDAEVRLSGDTGAIWAPCNVAVVVADRVIVNFLGDGALEVAAVIQQ